MKRPLRTWWLRLAAFAQGWWPDVFIAACDPVNPTLLVLAVRAWRHLGGLGPLRPAPAYGRASYEGGPIRSSSLTVTI